MIVAEIKLYDEPDYAKPKQQSYQNSMYNGYGGLNSDSYTTEELDKEILRAKAEGIALGNQYKYKHNNVILTVTGFTNDPDVGSVYGSPCIILCKRESDDPVISNYSFHYSIEELKHDNIEEIKNDTTHSC